MKPLIEMVQRVHGREETREAIAYDLMQLTLRVAKLDMSNAPRDLVEATYKLVDRAILHGAMLILQAQDMPK